MTTERSRYGLLVSSMGAALLAGSVFLPWYGIRFTAAGAGSLGRQLANHVGAGTLAWNAGGLHTTFAALAGQQLGALTAEQALSALGVILLVLAGLALLDTLLPLARSGARVPAGAGGAVVLLGIVASCCVLYRMIAPPSPAGAAVVLSLREGAWLALLGSLMVSVGGLWPRSLPAIATSEAFGGDIWASLTGGTAGGR
ncbi:MAG TPA: hypothetical protein VNV44_02825 [Solirubrobacteraceae bacterium]|jgi:hypothetical protein|nr:hypothetical protein [Solirubrobacteraceae bacterium]